MIDELADWLNATYPKRNWDQQCARLMWNAVYFISGAAESRMISYDPAKDAYRASHIESLAPGSAPPGALHYFANPRIEGHVALDVGGGLVLMTGLRSALGDDAQMLGTGYGLTTIASYMRAKGNPYLGWSYTYGANPSILDSFEPATRKPTPQPKRKRKIMAACVATPKGNTNMVRIFDQPTGIEHEFQASDKSYIRNVALTYGCSPDVPVSYITESHYQKIGDELAATRARLDARA